MINAIIHFSLNLSALFHTKSPAVNSIFFFLYINLSAFLQIQGKPFNEGVSDGPYIYRSERNMNIIWIKNGVPHKIKLTNKSFNTIKKDFDLRFDFHDLVATYFLKPDYNKSFRHVDSIAAISDIHGAYDGYISLLKAQGIIDNELTWKFGTGHLVILGDIFDRGDKVTEILWHLFGLEKQARAAGGAVHILLGNHELMTFAEDLRYTNHKYLEAANIFGVKYPALYSENAVLGRWLRFKPVVISLNNIIFVHGGISKEMLERRISMEEINKLFFQMLVQKAVESQNDIRNLVVLTEENGPVWYRGFFDEHSFPEERADSILDYYHKKNIVVGHTTSDHIRPLFNNKIIGIDAGLGNDMDGAMLIIKGDSFYLGKSDGRRSELR